MSYKDLQVNNRPVIPIDGNLWGTIIFDPDEGSPSYIGLHTSRSAAYSSNDWRILRLFRGTGSITQIHTEHGSWSARSLIF
jgi:hypothetical protein